MKEIFMLTFSFEDGFECIDEVLLEIKSKIFLTPVEPITWVKPKWSMQLQHALECYNVTVEEDDKNLCNINIHESEGQRQVGGSNVEIHDISKQVSTI